MIKNENYPAKTIIKSATFHPSRKYDPLLVIKPIPIILIIASVMNKLVK